jgi:dihydropyrimidine dehydrogenase (NAD+) subunit PreT
MGTGDMLALSADMVLTAIGQKLVPNGLDGSTELLTVDRGKIVVDAERRTSLPDVWAGGDAVHGPDLTVVAVEDGKIAVRAINCRLAA